MKKGGKKRAFSGSSISGTGEFNPLIPPSVESNGGNSAEAPPFEYAEISGRVLRLPAPRAEVVTFLRRVMDLVEAPNSSAQSVRAMVFGPDNPILARHPTLPGAYPDALTVREPAYWVCVDLVLRAEVREAGVSLENAGRPFTTTVSEAARKLNRVQSAIMNAVENRTLHVWMHEGRRYLLPAEVAAYSVPRRGKPPKNERE